MNSTNTYSRGIALILPVICLLSAAFALAASPLGTAFTYNGRLSENGGPANGLYDFRFAICDAATNGSTVSGLLTNAATPVANGLFAVTLDFGAGVFDGTERWLELGVRTNGGGEFITLAPRQLLTPTPYALYAPYAGVASAAATVTGPSGGMIISASDGDSNLVNAGYVKLGKVDLPVDLDMWKQGAGGAPPAASFRHTAVWTGSEMIVCGGSDVSTFSDTFLYTPRRALYLYQRP